MSQSEQILEHLEVYGQITPLDALQDYGCFRLAARIHELRAKGYDIRSQMAKRNGKEYAVYFLNQEQAA